MGKIKVINKNIDSDLIGNSFKNIASDTIFSFGSFQLTTNFTGKQTIDYSNELSSFVKPITLETLGVDNVLSKKIIDMTTNATLNLDYSDLKSYIRFGSTRELIRVSIQNIITLFPGSLFANSQAKPLGALTIQNYYYDDISKISEFIIPVAYLKNNFNLIFDIGNDTTPNDNQLKNLNLSYDKYVIWRNDNADVEFPILGFTGDTKSVPFINIMVDGNPFPELSATTSGSISYHLKPNVGEYNKFKLELNDLEKYIISERTVDRTGYSVRLKQPFIQDTGQVIYTTKQFMWDTTDRYNIDIDTSNYQRFLNVLLNIGQIYDEAKTDLIARFLTPESLKLYDLTQEGKVTKLLRIYGREFDEIRTFIDSLVTINKVSYDKKKNVPDQLVKNLAKTLGWNPFVLINEQQFANSFFSTEKEQTNNDFLPAEVDIELWRRILINTNYYWKAKGTRNAIKSILLLIGIPEPFINITEYIYTIDGRINPNQVTLTLADLPSASLPYDSQGYPIAPKETNDFYFQISGNTDGGQSYIDLYRKVGFTVNRIVDNKKSWYEAGPTERIHYSTPNYFQQDSRLILNTKEVDVTLDIARGIEYSVYCYNKYVDSQYASGVTKPYIYVNVPFDYGISANTFTIPDIPLSGSDIQLNFNGITLSQPTGDTYTYDSNSDYYRIDSQTVILNDEAAITHSNGDKDTITLTYIYDRLGTTGYTTVQYLVQAPIIAVDGTLLTLPEEPKGDVQLVVDGMTLTKGTSLFTGDFIINPANHAELIVQNNALKTYLQSNPIVRIWYIKDGGIASNATTKSEVHRVDSLNSSRVQYNAGTDQYSYVMDYKAFDVNSMKITLNGLTLQNTTDFTLDSTNKAKIWFKSHVPIQYGDIIGAYYIVDDGSYTPPLLPPDPDFPPIEDMSFLEYIEYIQRRLINVKTRKTITDHKTGFYPTLEKIYEEYLKRSFRPDDDPLKSKGYTFQIVYPFIEKYNAFFNEFVNNLLSSTIILRKGGILIRNTVFTRQKYMYRRGVNFDKDLLYLGDDGSEFIKTIPTNNYYWSGDEVCVSGSTS